MSRGILSIYWGDESKLPVERLKTSVRKFHPELPHEIIKIDAPAGDDSSLVRKAAMFDLSPFDETLYLDIDTVVQGNLNFGFEKAAIFGMAIALNECPWARRYHRIFEGDQIEYNTGVIFFTKKAAPVFSKWRELAPVTDSSLMVVRDGKPHMMKANDQGSFALAIEQTGFNPFVLPMNWNFRPMWHKSFFGPIKIWHDASPVPPIIERINSDNSMKGAVIQYFQAGTPPRA
ncbi:MAG: hypothetical protein K8R92_04850 [Planctomycetes bacterium]|nr:hypothetical protein [Planctomycetota bacterium]